MTRQDQTDNLLTGHRQINHILTRQDIRQTTLDRSQKDKPYIEKTGHKTDNPLTGHRQVNHISTRQDKTDNLDRSQTDYNILTRQDMTAHLFKTGQTDNPLTGHRQITI